MTSSPPPGIPPDEALAVAGRVDPGVHAALAEARRIRDGWAAALERARAAAGAQAAAELDRRWRAAQIELHREALELATSLAQRLAVDAASQRLSALIQALAPGSAPQRLTVWIAQADAARARAALPPGIEVRQDPTLGAGEIRVDDPHDLLGARLRGAVQALVTGP